MKWITTSIRVLLLWALFFQGALAQSGKDADSARQEQVYEVNLWVSGGIALTGVISNSIGHSLLRGKPDISEEAVHRITAKGVSGFDRWALRQDPSERDKAQKISDNILYPSVALPALLFIDKDIRRHWLDISLMYAETQSINSNLYNWSPLGPFFVERYRPVLYYEELPLEERNFGNLRNSFYSGHVGSTATGTFFAAKVFSDYHSELGAKKYLFFGLAAVPPALVAYYRIKALKHFPSDTIVGALVGASVGILVPELHRRWGSRLRFSATYSEQVKGMGLAYRF